MPFSMSRIVFVGHNALNIASKAASGPPAIQLLKNKQLTTRAWEVGKWSGEVGKWGSGVGSSYSSY